MNQLVATRVPRVCPRLHYTLDPLSEMLRQVENLTGSTFPGGELQSRQKNEAHSSTAVGIPTILYSPSLPRLVLTPLNVTENV